MRISCDELFGPAVGLTRFDSVDAAIASANDTNYELSAAVFTENLDNAMRFAREADSGNIHINCNCSPWCRPSVTDQIRNLKQKSRNML